MVTYVVHVGVCKNNTLGKSPTTVSEMLREATKHLSASGSSKEPSFDAWLLYWRAMAPSMRSLTPATANRPNPRA